MVIILQRMRGTLLLLLLILLLGLLASWGFLRLLAPNQVYVSCDSALAVHTREQINSCLSTIPIRSHGAHGISELLKADIPVVNLVKIRYTSSGQADVSIVADRPFIIINNIQANTQQVITHEGLLVAKNIFSENITSHLDTIVVAGEFATSDLYQVSRNISPELFKNYIITWHSPVKIILQRKDTNKRVIIAHAASVGDTHRIAYAERIFAYKKMGYKKGMQVDIRFGDYIVGGPLRGEVEYESTDGIS